MPAMKKNLSALLVLLLALNFAFAQNEPSLLLAHRTKPIAVQINKGDKVKIKFAGHRRPVKGFYHSADEDYIYVNFGLGAESEFKVDKDAVKHITLRTKRKLTFGSGALYGLSGASALTGSIITIIAIASYPPVGIYALPALVISPGAFLWAETFHRKRMSPFKYDLKLVENPSKP